MVYVEYNGIIRPYTVGKILSRDIKDPSNISQEYACVNNGLDSSVKSKESRSSALVDAEWNKLR